MTKKNTYETSPGNIFDIWHLCFFKFLVLSFGISKNIVRFNLFNSFPVNINLK